MSGFGLAWSSGSFGFTFSSYGSPYYHTRYYDSWSCGGWGYSDLYYGGWRNGWYGGFSYIYNPWPVYRSYYLYDPEPVILPAQTVYVTQPATTTYIVQSPTPAATTYVVENPAPAVTAVAYAEGVAQADPARTATVPSVQQAAPETVDLFPLNGDEFAFDEDTFNLGFSSYSESLDPETIWASYAGLDRWDTDTETGFYEATAAVDEGLL